MVDPFGLGSSDLDGSQFKDTFSLKTPADERKRPVGEPCRHREHRQLKSGKAAVHSVYQMKRGLVPRLFSHELEPGQAAEVALDFVHPFTEEPPLSDVLRSNIHFVCTSPGQLEQLRENRLEFWRSRAVALMRQSI